MGKQRTACLTISYLIIQLFVHISSGVLVNLKVWRRPSIGYAGPTGGDFPLVTREGHYVLDVIFTSPITNLGNFS